MLSPFSDNDGPPIESYQTYKAKKFHEYPGKIMKVVRGIRDTSLKLGDKKQLLRELKNILDNEITQTT